MEISTKTAVIFDFNRTIYDPDKNTLLPGAIQVLRDLQVRKIPLYLVSMGSESRPALITELGINDFFAKVFLVKEKNAAMFSEISTHARVPSQQIYVVGDHLHKEIRCGNQCGMKTIWLKRGKFAELQPETQNDAPWQTVVRMEEVLDLIV